MALDLMVFIFSMNLVDLPTANDAENAANMMQRALVSKPNTKRWPDGVVPYKIDDSISKIFFKFPSRSI